MASNDDEILLGSRVLAGKVPDTDGDGVSDAEEALAGTDPQDASDHPDRDPILKPRDDDPRGDLGRDGLERETAFDPAANMPEGTTIDSGLDGMANLDGSDLSKGPNHFGVGEDELLQGRGGSENPLNMPRDPTATSPRPSGPPAASQAAVGRNDDGASNDVGAKEGGSTPPSGADVSTRAPNSDLVSGEQGGADGGSFWDHPIDNTAKAISGLYSGGGTPEPPDAGTKRPDGDTAIPKPKPKKPVQPGSSDDYNVNPDADAGGGAPTDAELARVIVVHGGDTQPVDGQGAGPQVDADAPPPPKTDLVRDGGDQAGDLDMTQALLGAPDAPVVHTINPDSGAVPTVVGGGPGPSGGDGEEGMVVVDHTAAAFDGDGLQAMDGTVDLGTVADSHLGIDVGLAPEEGVPQDEGAFAGPLDDGFD